jgi:hypothetical protein
VTKVTLKDWDRTGCYWVLDTASGAALPADADFSHGFLCAFPGHDGTAVVPRVAAVYAEGGKLWFQVDGERLEVEDAKFDHRLDGSGASWLTVSGPGGPVLDIMYLGPGADPLNRRDPTFDALDMELQDIFYFLARNGRDPAWRAGILARWGEGIA